MGCYSRVKKDLVCHSMLLADLRGVLRALKLSVDPQLCSTMCAVWIESIQQ